MKRPYKEYLLNDWMRKKLKRFESKKKLKPEQDAFKAAERVRVQKYRQKKK